MIYNSILIIEGKRGDVKFYMGKKGEGAFKIGTRLPFCSPVLSRGRTKASLAPEDGGSELLHPGGGMELLPLRFYDCAGAAVGAVLSGSRSNATRKPMPWERFPGRLHSRV